MTKSSSFFENSRNPSINGGSFVHTENRTTHRQGSVFLGSIYGYTHTASGDGPVIGYLNQVTVSGSDYRAGRHSGAYQRELDVSLTENPTATHSGVVHEEPEPMTLADMRIGSGSDVERDGDMALVARSVAGPELHLLPSELEAEFATLSPELQWYIKSQLSRRAPPLTESPISDSGCDRSMVKSDIRGAAQASRPSSH